MTSSKFVFDFDLYKSLHRRPESISRFFAMEEQLEALIGQAVFAAPTELPRLISYRSPLTVAIKEFKSMRAAGMDPDESMTGSVKAAIHQIAAGGWE